MPRGLATGKGMSQAKLLSESGLYKFVMRSDKEQARPFQDWVTREVLPAIRKDGRYIRSEEKVCPLRLALPDVSAASSIRVQWNGG